MGGICKQENQITHFAQFSVVQILKQIENIPQKRRKDSTRNGELLLLKKRADRFVNDKIKRKRIVMKQTNKNTRRTDNNNKLSQKDFNVIFLFI